MADNEIAVLQTILYADLFDYPLTEEEIWRFLIADKPVIPKEIHAFVFVPSPSREKVRMRGKTFKPTNGQIGDITNHLIQVGDFYCLKGREEIVTKRLRREKESYKKLKIAKHAAKLLSHIPTVQLIGISGGLAMNNADIDDDIDLFIITRQNTMWLTRLLVIILLQLFGLRRKKSDQHVANMICTNFFLDESELSFTNHDLFTAHEIVQMKPIFERENTYGGFLQANKWVRNMMPNSLTHDLRLMTYDLRQSNNKLLLNFEKIAKILQLWYMRNHKTTEVTTDKKAAFHPFDHKKYVLEELARRKKEYGV